MKNKFSLFKGNGGFTLVELIVVIAILAILAGVAVPAYSGYIQKANKASDLQLLGAANQAFAAACAENNVDTTTMVGTEIAITSDGKLGTMTFNGITLAESVDYASLKLGETFLRYYGENVNTAFKYFVTKLTYGLDGFVGYGADEWAALGGAYSGLLDIILQNNPEWVETLNGSIWMDDSTGLGTQGLLDKVNDVTKFAAAADSAALATILNSPEFMGYAAGVLGVDPSDTGAINAKFGELAQAMVEQNPGMSPEQAAQQLRANAAVLYAAENTKDMTASDVTALLGSDGAKSTIISNLNSNPGTAMSQAAIAYGMYTAYAYSTGDEALIESTNDPLAILNGLNDDGFQAYINDANNAKDIDGYLAAMSMVSSSTGDMAAIDQLMVNGFDDPALSAMLNQLGSKK